MSTRAEPVGTLEVALAHASRLLGAGPAAAAEQACEILKVVPRQPQALLILGLARAAAGDIDGSIDALTRSVSLRPDLPDAWLALADQLRARGDPESADRAYAHYIKAATRDPRLLAAAAALCDNRIPEAEARLRTHLARHPNDVAALRMLAEAAARLQRYADARRHPLGCCFSCFKQHFARGQDERLRRVLYGQLRQSHHAAAIRDRCG